MLVNYRHAGQRCLLPLTPAKPVSTLPLARSGCIICHEDESLFIIVIYCPPLFEEKLGNMVFCFQWYVMHGMLFRV